VAAKHEVGLEVHERRWSEITLVALLQLKGKGSRIVSTPGEYNLKDSLHPFA
jgi:hypothetical protein